VQFTTLFPATKLQTTQKYPENTKNLSQYTLIEAHRKEWTDNI